MILFDDAEGHTTVAGTAAPVAVIADAHRDATDGADGRAERSREQTAREQVEEWLDAVALCFNLPEGRRWIDYERL